MSKKQFEIEYESLRNVTSKQDDDAGRERRCGVALADQFFDIPDDLNVREYLLKEVDGKKIKKRTDVNDAIRDTLDNNRERFAMLNGGITIICKSAAVDDKKRKVVLTDPSIINGSQTRGVLKEYFDEGGEDDTDYPSVHFELIVCDDSALAADITIARNFQNRVIPVSTYGARGLFDDLEEAMQDRDRSIRLRKSETDPPGEAYLDTEKLIQVVTCVVPGDINMPRSANEGIRAYAFSQKAVCLKDFAAIMEKDEFAEAKQFFHEVAYDAWSLYLKLKTERAFAQFRQKRQRQHEKRSPVKKDAQGNVIDVSMGVLFPILSALGNFVAKDDDGQWRFEIPEDYDLGDLISQAAIIFSQAYNDPAKMGKDIQAYLALRPIVTQYLKYRRGA